MADIVVRPEILVDPTTRPETAASIGAIDHRLHQAPLEYLGLVSTVNMQSATTADLPLPESTLTTASPEDVLTELVRQGYDKEGFDDGTELILTKDQTLRALY